MLSTFVVIYEEIQIAPLAQQARRFNHSVDTIEKDRGKRLNGIGAVAICNGHRGADVVIVDESAP